MLVIGEKIFIVKETGSRLSACLIKIRFSNLFLILLVNNPTYMYLGDLRVYFKLEEYFRALYYYMRNFCNLIVLEQWYFSLI